MQDPKDSKIIAAYKEYLAEARETAREFQDDSTRIWDMIHGRSPSGDGNSGVELEANREEGALIVGSRRKNLLNRKGMTKIHMNRVGLALQQIKAQFKQALMSFDKWLTVEQVEGLESPFLTDLEAKRAIEYVTKGSDLKAQLTDAIGISACENQLAMKVVSHIKKIKGPGGTTHSKLQLEFIPLSIFDYYEDPTGGDLYKIYEASFDKYQVLKMSSDGGKDKSKPFIKEVVKELKGNFELDRQDEQDDNKGHDTKIDPIGRRQQILIHEIWGTILDDDGNIMEYDGMELENVVLYIANESVLLCPPKKNPRFNDEAPFVSTTILRANLTKYGRPPLADGVEMNRAENKLMGSIIDAALKSQYNVNIAKPHGLINPKQVNGGLKPNQTILQNDQLPPGEKVIETLKTGQVDPGAFQVLSEIQRSGAENMFGTELSSYAAMPSKQVRATEVVQSQNVINGLFESFASDVEDTFIEPLVLQIFHEFLQHAGKLSDEGLSFIFGGNAERIAQFKGLSDRQRFEELAHSFRFRAKGVRGMLSNGRQSQTLVNLFSLVAANPIIYEAFQRSGVNVVKMFEKVISGQQLDLQEFTDEREADFARARQLIYEEAIAQAQAQGQNIAQPGGAQNASQGQGPSEVEPGSGAGAA